MSPDDPRHGTTAGYSQGCRHHCCRTAHTKWAAARRTKLYLLRTDSLKVSPVGTVRRIQALMALGWSQAEISKALGKTHTYAGKLMRQDTDEILRSTAEHVARVFDRMCMTTPDRSTPFRAAMVARSIRHARAMGYAPPLAYDNIDNPDERPQGWEYQPLADRREQLEELVERGVGLHVAIAELGISEDSIERWCQRYGCRHLYIQLRDNDGRPLVENANQYTKRGAA